MRLEGFEEVTVFMEQMFVAVLCRRLACNLAAEYFHPEFGRQSKEIEFRILS